MDRSELINSYVNYGNQTQNTYDTNLSYLENLKYRLTGCSSIAEIKSELYKFLDNNQIQGQIRDDLTKIAADFDETTDLYTAQRYLENYLGDLVDKNKKEADKAKDDVNQIRQDVVEDAKKDLQQVGVKLVGDEEEIFDSINDLDDVEKIKANVEEAKAHFEEEYRGKDPQDVIVDINTLGNSIENSGNQTLLNEAIDSQVELDSNSPVQDRGDGTIEVLGDSTNEESMNFVAMMTTALVASEVGNDLSMGLGLDMKMVQKENQPFQYKTIFGNFPISKMTDDKKLSPEAIAEIQELAKSYNPGKDYVQELSKSSPEIGQALELIDNNLLNKQGGFQFLLKNGGTEHDMMLAVDEHYTDVSNAFKSSGADVGTMAGTMVGSSDQENSIIRIKPEEQLVVLDSVNSMLKHDSLENTQENTLEQGVAMVKKYEPPKPEETDLNEAANASPRLLIIVTIAEVLLIGAYLFMMFNR